MYASHVVLVLLLYQISLRSTSKSSPKPDVICIPYERSQTDESSPTEVKLPRLIKSRKRYYESTNSRSIQDYTRVNSPIYFLNKPTRKPLTDKNNIKTEYYEIQNKARTPPFSYTDIKNYASKRRSFANVDTKQTAAGNDIDDLENKEIIEKSLVNCIDSYIVIIAKDKNLINLTDILQNKPLYGYDENSFYSETINKIRSSCIQLADVMEQSIREIKSSFSKKQEFGDSATDKTQDHRSTNTYYQNSRLEPSSPDSDSSPSRKLLASKAGENNTEWSINEITEEEASNATDLEDKNNKGSCKGCAEPDSTTPVAVQRDTLNHNVYSLLGKTTSPVPKTSTPNDLANTNPPDSTTPSYKDGSLGRNRSAYSEDEFEIPKMVTIELTNGTVVSTSEGTEALPNDDFLTDTPRASNEPYPISGHLYLLYDRTYVPARFVQTPSGNISLGIDGYSLCNQISNRQAIDSVILTVICKCIQNNSCR